MSHELHTTQSQNRMQLQALCETVQKIENRAQNRDGVKSGVALPHFQSEVLTHAGFETVTTTEYSWDGMKRRADAAHPFFVFQYTLAGWGCYSDESSTRKLLPGSAFLAVIPSPHHYYLPPNSPSWTFFYVLVSHDFITRRIAKCREETGPVHEIEPNSSFITRMVALFEGNRLGSFRDRYAAEGALFDFLLEYERFCYARPERENLLEEVRQRVLQQPNGQADVAQLAAERGMSRSNYSHYFKATTGTSPALFMRQVRLEEAVRRLLHTDQKLEHIARATGFANANHFCKVFRQRYRFSPGEFRRQIR
jgi:AraC-like DNA-binding protein